MEVTRKHTAAGTSVLVERPYRSSVSLAARFAGALSLLAVGAALSLRK